MKKRFLKILSFLLSVFLIIFFFSLHNKENRPAVVPGEGSSPGTCVNPTDGAELVYIPPGVFYMGAPEKDPLADVKEKPLRKVYLEGFYIYRYEVTRAQFKKFVESTGYVTEAEKSDKGHSYRTFLSDSTLNRPVLFMSWKDADAYCRWAGGRLPTEAQWEKAARGNKSQIYPWGDKLNPSFFNNSIDPHKADHSKGAKKDIEDHLPMDFAEPGGSYPGGVSPFGVHDMIGSVYEFCNDWYGPYNDCYEDFALYEPSGPPAGSLKIIKGGGDCDDVRNFRISARDMVKPEEFYCDFGFRPVMTMSDYKSAGKLSLKAGLPREMEFLVNIRDSAKVILFPFDNPKNNSHRKPDRSGIYAELVTYSQYKIFLSKTGYQPLVPGLFAEGSGKSAPVELYQIADAERYCRWAGGRLPSESEFNLYQSLTDRFSEIAHPTDRKYYQKRNPREWISGGFGELSDKPVKRPFRVYLPKGSIK